MRRLVIVVCLSLVLHRMLYLCAADLAGVRAKQQYRASHIKTRIVSHSDIIPSSYLQLAWCVRVLTRNNQEAQQGHEFAQV